MMIPSKSTRCEGHGRCNPGVEHSRQLNSPTISLVRSLSTLFVLPMRFGFIWLYRGFEVIDADAA